MSPQRGKERQQVLKVVQIFNPTVIKTDVANFREMVQELTGINYQPARRSKYRSSSRQRRSVSSSSSRMMMHYEEQVAAQAASMASSCSSPSSSSCSDELPSAFDDIDILSALISSHPLPDCTMLPPLVS